MSLGFSVFLFLPFSFSYIFVAVINLLQPYAQQSAKRIGEVR